MRLKKFALSFTVFIFGILFVRTNVLAATTTSRIAGADRYETAIKISQDSWTKSDYIVLVAGENFPDALSAAPLAKKYNAPILLTDGNSLRSDVLTEIQRLGATKAYIVGGPGAVPLSIDSQLSALNISCIRIQGQDRYETSSKVAALIGTSNGAFIVPGENFPDALSIASIAAAKQMPILLTGYNAIPDSVKNYISSSNINKFYVVGGTGVISEAAVSSLPNRTRLSGASRYDTNLAVIKQFQSDFNFSNVFLSTGENFADSLAGAASAGKFSSPIILCDNSSLVAQDTVQQVKKSISVVKVLGGTSIISDSFVQNLVNPYKVVLGYATYYYSGDAASYNSMVNNHSSIDQIAAASYSTDGSGNITGLTPSNQLTYANSNGIQTQAMIANNFSGSIAKTLLESPANRQNAINNILQLLKAQNYKGVNIDIEAVYASDRNYFTTFMSDLYNTLHPLGYTVAVAVPAKTVDNPSNSWNGAYDYAALSNYADEIILMTYDEHWSGGEPGAIASIGWVENVVKYAITVIPRNKIMFGIDSYGYDWPSNGNPAQAYGLDKANSTAAQYGTQIIFDNATKSPYFTYMDSSNVNHTVWFENSQSIGYKLDLVNSYNLRGIAQWRLGLENSDYWTTIRSYLNKK